jgi:hypothetical protein
MTAKAIACGKPRVQPPSCPLSPGSAVLPLNQPPAQIEEGISFVDPELRLDVQDIQRQIAWFKAQGMLPAHADGEAMIDRRYVVRLVTN